MATGDITSVEIPATAEPFGACADIEVEGFTTGMAVDFGSGFGSDLDDADLASATIVFTVVSEGYDATGTLGTVTRTVYATKIVRQPYPNDASNDESTTAGGAKIRVALSDVVYDDDRNGGAGTSGTDPVVAIAAGAIRNDGGAGQTSNAASAFTVTNNSTADYPVAKGRWERLAGAWHLDAVKSDFTIGCKPDCNLGLACVVFDAVGRTSAHAQSATVTDLVARFRRSGLYVPSARATIPVAGFTQGELIDCRFRVYPAIGDADSVLDTDGRTTQTEIALGRNTATILCDKDDLLDEVRYVAPAGSGGSDANDGLSPASPMETIGAAANDGANLIRAAAGTYPLGAVAINTAGTPTDRWLVIAPADGEDASTVKMRLDTTNRNAEATYTKFDGVGLEITATGAWYGGSDSGALVWAKSCTMSETHGGSQTTPAFRAMDAVFVDGCDGALGSDAWKFNVYSADRAAYCFDGCDFGPEVASASILESLFEFDGCRYRGDFEADLLRPGQDAASPAVDNFSFAFNRITSDRSGGIAFNDAVSIGGRILGNVYEREADGTANFAIFDDVASANVNFSHNTLVGVQVTIAYNSVGSASVPHRNWRAVGNAVEDYATKHDTFGTPDGGRTGGWPVMYGVGFRANHFGNLVAAGGFEYGGLDFTTGGTIGVIDNEGVNGGATGEGDYTPAAGSVLLSRVAEADSIIATDLDGTDLVFPAAAGGKQIADAVAPTLSSPTGIATGGATADLGVTTDEAGGALYAVVTASATSPSPAQVKAGQNHNGFAAAFDGSQSVSATGAQTIAATGLSEETTYYAHFMHEDAAGNQSAVATSSAFTTPDATAPTLSSPTGSATGGSTADLGVTTDEADGALYAVVTASATAPSAAQVKAGQDHTGGPAAFADSQAVASTGSKSFSATGLSSETTYHAHFMHEDAAGNQSAVASSSSFTTDDVTLPTVTGAIIAANGTTFALAFSESVSRGSGHSDSDLTLQTDKVGRSYSLAYTSGDGTSAAIYTITPAVGEGETLTLDYAQPGDGLEDGGGNDLASFTGAVVTNNSEQDQTPPTRSNLQIAVNAGETGFDVSFDTDEQLGSGPTDIDADVSLSAGGLVSLGRSDFAETALGGGAYRYAATATITPEDGVWTFRVSVAADVAGNSDPMPATRILNVGAASSPRSRGRGRTRSDLLHLRAGPPR